MAQRFNAAFGLRLTVLVAAVNARQAGPATAPG
jgi:hypothetical protein